MKPILLLLAAAWCGTALAEPVASILADPARWDGTAVTIVGEAVGDVIEGRGGFWINVLDGETAVGVWCRPEMRPSVTTLGRYRTKGDTLRITGAFRRRCPVHLGDTDIHAAVLERLAVGGPVGEEPGARDVASAALFSVLCLACVALFRVVRSPG